jgi:hypothetical protein
VFIAVAIMATSVIVALVQRRRRPADVPTQATASAPAQLDRHDFSGPEIDWLLVVFTSATCHTCADVANKARVAASAAVRVVEVEYGAERDLHRRYGIDAVPTTVLADRTGVVRASFMGPVSAADLWAAIAEARAPGSSAEQRGGSHHPPVA